MEQCKGYQNGTNEVVASVVEGFEGRLVQWRDNVVEGVPTQLEGVELVKLSEPDWDRSRKVVVGEV